MTNMKENNNDPPKKRGRPRKNQIIEKQTKKESKQVLFNQEKEIILHLPLLIRDLDNANQFSEHNDDSDSDESQTLLTLSDKDDMENSKNYYDIMQELQEKDKIIRQLKDEVLEYTNALTEYSNTVGEKDNFVVNMKIPLIDHKDGKQIIPTKTDICCWWCTYNFDTLPVYIPEQFHNDNFFVFGCFCSFNCACAYNLSMSDYKVKDRHSLLLSLASLIYKKNVETDLYMAPAREVLEKYGGPVSIADYRKNFKLCSKEYRLIIPPMSSIIPTVEILTREKIIFGKHDVNKFSQCRDEKSGIFDVMGIRARKK